MDFLDALIHLAGWAAPAAWVAAVLWVGLMRSKTAPRLRAAPLFVVLWLSGLLVLGLGLWWQGRDGKMLTYGAMVTVMGLTAWGLSRGRTGRSGR